MRRLVAGAVVGLLGIVLLALAGCGGGQAGTTVTEPSQQMITSVGWLFDNTPADYSSSANRCSLLVTVYYDVTIAAADIESLTVTSPSGGYWTVPAQSSQFGTSSSGKPYLGRRLLYPGDTRSFPLAGTWTFQLKLKNGTASTSFTRTFHNPGTSSAATYAYVYTPEEAGGVMPSSYVALLRRFPSEGYTLQYSPAGGGSITSSGLSAVGSGYLAQEPRAYNTHCWLFDVNNNYLGSSVMAFWPLDHSSTGLMTPAGELNLVPSKTVAASGTGTVDLAQVAYLRVIIFDGAQYAPTSSISFDLRSVSSRVPVQHPAGRTLEGAVPLQDAYTPGQ